MMRRRVLPRGAASLSEAQAIAAKLTAELSRPIFQVRTASRAVGATLARQELGLGPGAFSTASTVADAARAVGIANKLGRDWLSRYLKFLPKGEEAATKAAVKTVASRFETIAITEANEALNAERIATAQRELGPGYELIEIWDAVLDKRTCQECWSLHGTRIRARDGFPGGVRPGAVHGRCRCSSSFEAVPLNPYDWGIPKAFLPVPL